MNNYLLKCSERIFFIVHCFYSVWFTKDDRLKITSVYCVFVLTWNYYTLWWILHYSLKLFNLLPTDSPTPCPAISSHISSGHSEVSHIRESERLSTDRKYTFCIYTMDSSQSVACNLLLISYFILVDERLGIDHKGLKKNIISYCKTQK